THRDEPRSRQALCGVFCFCSGRFLKRALLECGNPSAAFLRRPFSETNPRLPSMPSIPAVPDSCDPTSLLLTRLHRYLGKNPATLPPDSPPSAPGRTSKNIRPYPDDKTPSLAAPDNPAGSGAAYA